MTKDTEQEFDPMAVNITKRMRLRQKECQRVTQEFGARLFAKGREKLDMAPSIEIARKLFVLRLAPSFHEDGAESERIAQDNFDKLEAIGLPDGFYSHHRYIRFRGFDLCDRDGNVNLKRRHENREIITEDGKSTTIRCLDLSRGFFGTEGIDFVPQISRDGRDKAGEILLKKIEDGHVTTKSIVTLTDETFAELVDFFGKYDRLQEQVSATCEDIGHALWSTKNLVQLRDEWPEAFEILVKTAEPGRFDAKETTAVATVGIDQVRNMVDSFPDDQGEAIAL